MSKIKLTNPGDQPLIFEHGVKPRIKLEPGTSIALDLTLVSPVIVRLPDSNVDLEKLASAEPFLEQADDAELKAQIGQLKEDLEQVNQLVTEKQVEIDALTFQLDQANSSLADLEKAKTKTAKNKPVPDAPAGDQSDNPTADGKTDPANPETPAPDSATTE